MAGVEGPAAVPATPSCSSYDPRVRCSVEEAFPAALRADVVAVTGAATVTECKGPFVVVLRGERLVIPYRVHADAALLERAEMLSPTQREILFCIFSRHYDGRVRERALREIVRSSNPLVIPFVVQMFGDYVYEYLRVWKDA